MAATTAPRLLIIPGLHDSPPEHWQSWLQSVYRPSLRVTQRDWATPDVERWAARVGSTIERAGTQGGPFLVAAHSFGALAVMRHLALRPDSPIAAVLLVAPADPDRFGVGSQLPEGPLAVSTTVVLSTTDPWMSFSAGQRWARRWGAHLVNMGDAGHINASAGFATLPFARRWVIAHSQRLARHRRPARASALEWSFAV